MQIQLDDAKRIQAKTDEVSKKAKNSIELAKKAMQFALEEKDREIVGLKKKLAAKSTVAEVAPEAPKEKTNEELETGLAAYFRNSSAIAGEAGISEADLTFPNTASAS